MDRTHEAWAVVDVLPKPREGGSVWPRESCPEFNPRSDYRPFTGPQCWYCKFADFHLKESVALDVGICCYPTVQIL